MRRIPILSGAVLALLATACATGPTLTREQRIELYRAHAGAPVASFSHNPRAWTRWTPLDDRNLAVWTHQNRSYLLEVRRCPGLNFATSISITSAAGRVRAGFDDVVPHTAAGVGSPASPGCRIQVIRPLDSRALSEAKREMFEVELIEQAPDAVEDTGDGAG